MANLEEDIEVKAKLDDTNLMVSKIVSEYLNKIEQSGEPYVISDMIKGKFEVEKIDSNELSSVMLDEKNGEQNYEAVANLPKTKVINDKKVDIDEAIKLHSSVLESSNLQNYELNQVITNSQIKAGQNQSHIINGMTLDDEIKAYKQAHPEEFKPEPEIVIEKNGDEEEKEMANKSDLKGVRFNEFGEIIREPENLTSEENLQDIPTFVPPQNSIANSNAINEQELFQNEHISKNSKSQFVSGKYLEDEIKAFKQTHPEEFEPEPEIVIEKSSNEEEKEMEQTQTNNKKTLLDKTNEPDMTVGSYVKEGIKEDINDLKERIKG